MSLISRNAKEYVWDFLSLRYRNHLVLAGANNRNVIITYRFLAAPLQLNVLVCTKTVDSAFRAL